MSTDEFPLERHSGIALWRQIADKLRQALPDLADERGKLPPEPVLAEQFQVNRLTLRSAVKALVDEGILRREQGRGTFVIRQKRLTYPISRRTRFSAGLAQQADEREVRVIGTDGNLVENRAADKLKLPAATRFERIETVSLADNIPVIWGMSWFPTDRFSGIGERIEEHRSITKALRDFGVEDYMRETTEIEALLADIEDRKRLQLSPGAVVLKTTAVNVDADFVRIQFTESCMAANRVVLKIDSELPER
ncbi:MAG: phosphonate metabolism transcriptional regulator PhnF [Pseudomonadota bacterium]